MRLPRRYGPLAYGLIQSAMTTGVATAVALFKQSAGGTEFIVSWLPVWGLSWLAMLPVVVGLSPLIQRAITACIEEE